jgi:hypothetical protein
LENSSPVSSKSKPVLFYDLEIPLQVYIQRKWNTYKKGQMKVIKVGGFGWCTFYTCMNMHIETCQNHFKKGSGGRGIIMEGMNQTEV